MEGQSKKLDHQSGAIGWLVPGLQADGEIQDSDKETDQGPKMKTPQDLQTRV